MRALSASLISHSTPPPTPDTARHTTPNYMFEQMTKSKHALRTIPPFNILTEDIPYEYESEAETPAPPTPPFFVVSDLPQYPQAFETSSSGSHCWDSEVEPNKISNRSSRSTSPSSSTRGSSVSSYKSFNHGSDSDTAHTSSRGSSPITGKWFETTLNLATLDPMFSHPTLPIQWPYGDQLATDVVYDLQGYWFPMPIDHALPRAKSPSLLPFLTPSPPSSVLGNRASPEVEEVCSITTMF